MRTAMRARLIFISLIGVLGTGAVSCYAPINGDSSEQNTGTLEEVPIVEGVGTFPIRKELDQAWDAATREAFWFTSQGSQILPYSWFTWLELPNSEELFRSAEHMESLKFLPEQSSAINRSGLPIGFALDHDNVSGKAWMGFTCAACHTNQINYRGTKILVEGAPTLANVTKFLSELSQSLSATLSDDAKFDRFAQNVLGANNNANTRKSLRSDLFDEKEGLAERERVNKPPYSTDYTGYARLDAIGNIFNAATVFGLGDLTNGNLTNAPVSYPFLWGTHQSDVVQWNGSAPNTPLIGPMIRNAGEVVGVFGRLEIKPTPWWKFWRWRGVYKTTIKFNGLGMLEGWVKTLLSPQWPENILPILDDKMVINGQKIYEDSNCSSCHQVIPRHKQTDDYDARMINLMTIGTDPNMATNAATDSANTLALKGKRKLVFVGKKFKAKAPALDIVSNALAGVILRDPIKVLEGALLTERQMEATWGDPKEGMGRMKGMLEEHYSAADATLRYKARPLTGIWATAPYLHNGSVPNLWELLQEPQNRVKNFYVGSREFDPVNVGFSTLQVEHSTQFRVLDETGEPFSGNSNAGHVYGTNLSDIDKRFLIEYLKSL